VTASAVWARAGSGPGRRARGPLTMARTPLLSIALHPVRRHRLESTHPCHHLSGMTRRAVFAYSQRLFAQWERVRTAW
jgi:hypothetical protein